jgi:hypothetical protein
MLKETEAQGNFISVLIFFEFILFITSKDMENIQKKNVSFKLRYSTSSLSNSYLKKQVFDIGKTDLKAFESFLEGKKFLMGEKICNEDASIFSLMTTLINHDRTSLNKYVMGK